ncbi:MAG: carbohydrate ABC transporter permease [Bacillota bacterium]|nr:carbohydrate ABC transporter permease [Bacillota bacterium]
MSRRIKKSWHDQLFFAGNNLFMLFLIAITLLPFLHVVAKAFSGDTAILAGKVLFWPLKPQMNALRYVVSSKSFLKAFGYSVYLVFAGTAISMILTMITSYPLSKTRIKGRKILLLYFVFTMLFSGGLVPNYLLRFELGLIDTYWAVILPGLAVFNMLIFKNFFEQIPDSLEESAAIDGAGNLTIMTKIYLPLSLPAVATLTLFYAVGYWNNYFGPMIYLTNSARYPLQLYLRSVIHLASLSEVEKSTTDIDLLMHVATESVVAATVVASTLPILVLYPFLQKYFVKGMIIGSVKG